MSEHAAALAQQAVAQPQAQQHGAAAKVELAQHVFRVLHGMYGNLFLAKFSTGQERGDGTDGGVESAKAIWGHALSRYALDTVKAALASCLQEHPEYPPSLPQFVSLCAAKAPRPTYAQQQGWKSLPPPAAAPAKPVAFEARADGKDWARRILARHEAGEAIGAYALGSAHAALGLQCRAGVEA